MRTQKIETFNKYLTTFGLVIIFCGIFLLLFWKLIFVRGYINYGDNTYLYDKTFVSGWSPYLDNGVTRDSVISSYGYSSLSINFITALGLGDEAASKIIFFTPILLTLCVLFLVFSELSKSRIYALFAVLIFLLCGETVEYLLFFPIPYFYSITSFICVVFLSYISFRKNIISWNFCIISAILSILTFHPFFFIIYFLYLFLFELFYLYKNPFLVNFCKFLVTLFLILLVNFYWIMPFVIEVVLGSTSPEGVYGATNLSSVSSAYVSVSTLTNIILGATYPVRESGAIVKNNYTYIFSFIFLGVFVFNVIFNKKDRDYRIKFLIIILAILLSLSFWPNNMIMKYLWSYIWDKYEFFQFFRSVNRFSIVLIPLMFFIMAIYYLKSSKRKIYLLILCALTVLLFFGRRQLMSGDFGGYIPIYDVPEEYKELNIYLNKYGTNNTRILSYPKTDYEAYIWNKNVNYKEFPQLFNFIEFYLKGTVLNNRYGNHIINKSEGYALIFDTKRCLVKDAYLHKLGKLSVDYIILQKDFIKRNGSKVSYEEYRECLSNSNFRLLFDNNYFEFFEIEYPFDIDEGIEIKEIHPFYYQMDLDFMGKDSVELIFPQNYNSGWGLYSGNAEKLGFFEKNAIPLFNEKLDVQNTDNIPGNKWVLSRGDFGEDRVSLHLYYYPQIYVFIGSIVTVVTLISLISSSILIGLRDKDSRKKEFYVD